jgi:hypothetical protein
MTLTREKLITRSDNCLGATVCTKNLTSSGPALQPRLLGKKPANNRSSYGTNLQYEPSSQLKV